MNLRDLEYLIAVADLKSFSRAAEFCFVSQPTLSAQIKKLEDFLGVQIFERNNKQLLLTEVGEAIVESARLVLRESLHLQEIAALSKDPLGGTFRLGAFPSLSVYIFPKTVLEIKAKIPKLRLILVEEKTTQLVEKLATGQLDAALIALPLHDDRFVSQPVLMDPFYLAVPAQHPLIKNKIISKKDLQNQRLFLLEEGHCLRDQALDVCALTGAKEEEEFRATSLETLRQMVRAGTGVTLIPEIAIQKNDKDIAYIPFEDPAPNRIIGLVWRKTSPRTKLMKKIIDILRK